MVKEILEQTGLPHRETRFLRPPSETYAAYFDSFESRGADDVNLLEEHDYTIELYSYQPDKVAEKKIETALDGSGISYEKQERMWLESEQLYMVIYEFTAILKKEGY